VHEASGTQQVRSPIKEDNVINPTQRLRNIGRIGRIGVAGAAIAALLASSGTVDAHRRDSYHGRFNETAAGADPLGYDIHGVARMTTSERGTVVWVVVTGLDPDKNYGSHLHNGTCADGGGGHYQNEEGGATSPPNELWVSTNGTTIEPNRHGIAFANGAAKWTARTSGAMTTAQSVVVHEPGGVRIACADLD
jgi:hypothetical protein